MIWFPFNSPYKRLFYKVGFYFRTIHQEVRRAAAKEWCLWEMGTSKLIPDSAYIDKVVFLLIFQIGKVAFALLIFYVVYPASLHFQFLSCILCSTARRLITSTLQLRSPVLSATTLWTGNIGSAKPDIYLRSHRSASYRKIYVAIQDICGGSLHSEECQQTGKHTSSYRSGEKSSKPKV